MTNSIILENLDTDGLREIVREVIRAELKVHEPKAEENYFTRHQLSKKLNVSLPTLDKAIKSGKIKGHRLNGRILFLESEIKLDEIPARKKTV